jgi:cell division protein FtsZ
MNTNPFSASAKEPALTEPALTEAPATALNPAPGTAPESGAPAGVRKTTIKFFGVGNAGIKVLERVLQETTESFSSIALDSDEHSLTASSSREKMKVAGVDVVRLAEDGITEPAKAGSDYTRLKSLCSETDVIFIIAGLGGVAGGGLAPMVARAAKDAGALALAFVTTPFDCEGSRRREVAMQSLAEIKAAADGVICLPNQKAFKLIDENTSVLDTFRIVGDLLADAVRGVWRLLAHRGLIEIHFSDLCALVRDRHAESSFAVAEAMGPTRSREVVDTLLAHPMLEAGQILDQSEAVLVSLLGGPDLTMAEVNRVMEQIQGHCQRAQIIMGAALDESFRDRLAVTLIASQKGTESRQAPGRQWGRGDELGTQLLTQSPSARPNSRFVPPAPALQADQMEQLLARQRTGSARQRKAISKMQQSQLPLEIISKGRFDKSEPTIHKGEDLDVPTYIRRGVSLN